MEEERSAELLRANIAAWDGALYEPAAQDSSLKKNNAFVKKLSKGVTRDQQDAILKEMRQLSLGKFLGELSLAVQEGLLRSKTQDTLAAMEIVSLLHQRFCPEFTPSLLTWFLEQIESPALELEPREEKERIAKVKVLLRLITVLTTVGVFRDVDDTNDLPSWVYGRKKTTSSVIVIALKEILSYKLPTGLTLSVATGFVKRFAGLLEQDKQAKAVLQTYTEAVVSRTKLLHSKLQKLSQRKRKEQIRTGRIVEETEVEFKELAASFESFQAASEILAPALGIELPVFEEEEDEEAGAVIVNKVSAFQNDDEKKFYQTFPEIPQELIDDASTDPESSRGQDMTDFLIQLESALTPKEIDECVLQFFKLKLNNKASKNRLIRHIMDSKEVGKAKVYSRFLKACSPHLDDIKDELVTYLDGGFRSQIHRDYLNFKNIIFFCEMIKFELIPDHITFHKIRSLIMNLATPNNIEILSIFFEISGKFLLSEHAELMEEMLTLLEKKRKTAKLTISNKMAISNMLLVLKPPSIKTLQVAKKDYSPEQLFLKEIVRNELNRHNVSEVRQILQSVDLTNQQHFDIMMRLFTKPYKLSYENIVPLARLLKTANSNIRISVVDTVIENIIRGMEVNDYRFNRIRLAFCKYIAEIYEQGIIGIAVIHDLVFKILTFGHPNNSPSPMTLSELDHPDDYFRIQMSCMILQNITVKERDPKFMGRFDVLLHFFDYYIWIKEQPIPKDTDFKIKDCFAKFKYQRSTGITEAVESLSDVVKEKGFMNESPNDDEDEDEDEDDDENEDDEDDDEDDIEDDENEEVFDTELEVQKAEEDQENQRRQEEAKLSYEAYERKLQEEEEKRIDGRLEKEFKKLVSDSMNLQKDTKNANDLPQSVQGGDADEGIKTTKTGVAFKLVTRKGKNVSTRQLEVPKDVKLATNVVAEERRSKLEKKKLNEFILSKRYNDDDDNNYLMGRVPPPMPEPVPGQGAL